MLRQIHELFTRNEERKLIRTARRNGEEDFTNLFRLHESSLRGFLQSRVGTQAVEDVLQEIRIAAWQAFPRFDERSRFRSWVFGIARHKCMDFHRDSFRQVNQTIRIEDEEREIPDPDNDYTMIEERLWVAALLTSLTPEQKEVMELYYYGELTLAEIATISGRNLNTIKAQFYRAHIRASTQAEGFYQASNSLSKQKRSGGISLP